VGDAIHPLPRQLGSQAASRWGHEVAGRLLGVGRNQPGLEGVRVVRERRTRMRAT
jgi:hypothetical protein